MRPVDEKRDRGPRVVVVNSEGFVGGDTRRDRVAEQADDFDDAPTQPVIEEPVGRPVEHSEVKHSEEIQRIHVEDEDRLAFRVGVNILTLILIGLAAYVVWRNFFQ